MMVHKAHAWSIMEYSPLTWMSNSSTHKQLNVGQCSPLNDTPSAIPSIHFFHQRYTMAVLSWPMMIHKAHAWNMYWLYCVPSLRYAVVPCHGIPPTAFSKFAKKENGSRCLGTQSCMFKPHIVLTSVDRVSWLAWGSWAKRHVSMIIYDLEMYHCSFIITVEILELSARQHCGGIYGGRVVVYQGGNTFIGAINPDLARDIQMLKVNIYKIDE